jgi:hypothetical protein
MVPGGRFAVIVGADNVGEQTLLCTTPLSCICGLT